MIGINTMDKIIVEIKVTNKFGQESIKTFKSDYDGLHNNEWNEIVRGLLDETITTKEF